MHRRIRAAVATATLVLSVCAFGLVGGGTAAAAEPVVVGECDASVRGTPGQPVSLAPAAVLGIVTDAVRAVPLLGPPLAGAAEQAFAALPPIPIGVVPTGTWHISGATVADAVTDQLRTIPLLGPVLGAVVTSVRSTLTTVCGVTVTAVNTLAAPVQDGADAVADTSQEATERLVPGGLTGHGPGGPDGEVPGGGPGSNPGGAPDPNRPPPAGIDQDSWSLYPPGSGNLARSPTDFYGRVPFARPGMFTPSPGTRYGGGVPGNSPQFGVLGADRAIDDGVHAAGRAEVLDARRGQRIELPVLLAVLALSVVTATLVRTWVLRRTPPAAP